MNKFNIKDTVYAIINYTLIEWEVKMIQQWIDTIYYDIVTEEWTYTLCEWELGKNKMDILEQLKQKQKELQEIIDNAK